MGRGDVFSFHLSTFILFLVQGFLMFLLYFRICGFPRNVSNAGIAAFLAVSWYLLHPANAETINYIIARSDSLSTLLVVASFVLFIYSRSARKWHFYLMPMSLGILAKPSAFVFAPLLFFYVLLFEEKISLTEAFKKDSRLKIASVFKKTAPAFIACLALVLFIRSMDPPTWKPGGSSLFNYVITQPFVILHYFITFFLPVSLSADTDWTTLPGIMDGRFIIGFLFIAGLFYAAVVTSRDEKTRPISFGILWFFISLMPASLIPLAEVMNDHRVFLPYVGLAMAICWTINLIVEKFKLSFTSEKKFYRATAAVILTVLAVYAYGTYERNKVWKTEETLWRDVTEKSPKNGRGLMNYGLALMARADYTGAETYFTRALAFTPKYPYLHINLGVVKAATGASAEAEHYFRNALSFGPNYPECYFFYARFLRDQRRSDEAIGNLKKALELSSGHMEARYMLMSLYFEKDDRAHLRELAEDTLRIFPNDRQSAQYLSDLTAGKPRLQTEKESANANSTPEGLLNLSLKYYQAKQFHRSIEAASEALKLKPDYALAYNNICAAYNELKQWDKAIEAGEKAVKLAPDNQLAINNLLWAKKQKLSEKTMTR
jgi:tetratricopeptide (TPR) repeat protein